MTSTSYVMKVCTKCLTPKGLEAFGAHKMGVYGKRPSCKTCVNQDKKAKRAQYTATESARRSKGKIQLSTEQRRQIRVIYNAAKTMREQGLAVAVDHIDPINGVLVCGFHCPDNLMIITAEANMKKSNSFQPYRVQYLPDGSTVTTLV